MLLPISGTFTSIIDSKSTLSISASFSPKKTFTFDEKLAPMISSLSLLYAKWGLNEANDALSVKKDLEAP